VNPLIQQSGSPRVGPDQASGASSGAESAVDGGVTSDVLLQGIRHDYGGDDVLRGVDLVVEHGELVTLLGPSGSGKSTLLRIVGGLEHPKRGRVEIGGVDVTRVAPNKREVGIVFQNYALFPHMTVAENVGFPLRMRKVRGAQARTKIESILRVVELDAFARRYPAELSGGQQQRVALARALVFEPRVLLLDEPFGALDRRLREQLGLEVRRVQRELGITTIFVTHDQDEAFTMSTRIVVMDQGELLQADRPSEVYRRPSSLKVARYLGALNEFPVKIVTRGPGWLGAEGPGRLPLRIASASPVGDEANIRCGIRPEHLRISKTSTPDCTTPARVQAAIFGGDWTRVQLLLDEGPPLLAVLPHGAAEIADGDRVFVGVADGEAMLFEGSVGTRLA
jgi:ABC-type Fe3+/spermidine/putrescine transport system ATPase subunit